MSAKKLRVAIMGAGLGGLCLAQGLKKNGIAFDVFEQDLSASSRTQGYRIRIDKTGQEALAQCLPPMLKQLFTETCSIPSPAPQAINGQLEIIKGRWPDSWSVKSNQDGEDLDKDRVVNRLTLREILMCGIEENIHFGKSFDHYEENERGQVVSYFTDGTSITSDLLVAADGVNSAVRAQRWPYNNPIDTGVVCIYGKTFLQASPLIAPILQKRTSVVFEKNITVIIDPIQFKESPALCAARMQKGSKLTHVDDYIYWAVIGARNCFGLTAESPLRLSTKELQACVEKVNSTWSPSLKALFKSVSTETLSIVPVRSSKPQEAWSSTGVTVLGDAIHVMSPAGGLGANTALYDAAALATHLSAVISGQKTLLQALNEYELILRTHGAEAIQTSLQAAKVIFGDLIRAADAD